MTSEFAHSLSHIKHEYLENGGISLQKMSLIFVMIDPLKKNLPRLLWSLWPFNSSI